MYAIFVGLIKTLCLQNKKSQYPLRNLNQAHCMQQALAFMVGSNKERKVGLEQKLASKLFE